MEVLTEIFVDESSLDNRDELGDGSKNMEISPELEMSGDFNNSRIGFDNTKKTKNILSKYEKTRILGARATLLSKGAQPLVNPDGETNPLEIARMELNERVIPIVIRRHLPNGEYEDWRLQDLI